MVRQAERDIMLRQHFKSAAHTNSDPEFKAVPSMIRQHFKKPAEPIGVRLEVGWALEEDRSVLASQQG
jgi:hypothetical protein